MTQAPRTAISKSSAASRCSATAQRQTWQFFLAVPCVDKALDLTPPGQQRITREANGIGDARLFARYTVLQRNTLGRTFRVAPFLGIEMPTGDDNDRDGLGRLPPQLQPGSGAWDPLGGLIATYQALAYEVDAQLSYKANRQANRFRFGDEFRFDTSLQVRVWPRELGDGVPGF